MTQTSAPQPDETLAIEVLKIAATLTQARLAWSDHFAPGRALELDTEQQFQHCFCSNIVLTLRELDLLHIELSRTGQASDRSTLTDHLEARYQTRWKKRPKG